MRDKRVDGIKAFMQAFEIFCLCIFLLFVFVVITAYFTLRIAKVDIPLPLQASFVAVLIILCVLWVWGCVITPIADAIKNRKEKRKNEENTQIH